MTERTLTIFKNLVSSTQRPERRKTEFELKRKALPRLRV